MSKAAQNSISKLSDEQFDRFVNALLDCTHFAATGEISVNISVKNIEALNELLGLPQNDNRTVITIIEALSKKIVMGCGVIHDGGCRGSVQFKTM